MNEIDKLRHMLDEAHIPYESIINEFDSEYISCTRCEADKYITNQIIYGRTSGVTWKLDAIWQNGSYGREAGLLETYGELGTSEDGDPMVMDAEQAFRIISKDWRKENGMPATPVRHGHWIGKPIAGYSTVRCSECGDVFLENEGKWNYCPSCGAKME